MILKIKALGDHLLEEVAVALVAEAEERNGAGDTRVTASVVASVVAEVEARPAPRSGSPHRLPQACCQAHPTLHTGHCTH